MQRFIDSHFHLWRRADIRVPGPLTFPMLDRDFGWEDFAQATAGLDLADAVMVQVDHDPGDGEPEVAWIEAVAAEHPELAAMVAWAPLERDDVRDHLDRLARHAIVRGVRRNTQHEADPMFCARPEFLAGAALLADYGLACDICALAEQLEGVVELARACPQTTIVLNHIGKPDLSEAAFVPWAGRMAQLADCKNIVCKLSPVIRGPDSRWDRESILPFAETVLRLFGCERVLWASNWPVMTVATDYRAWFELAEALVADRPAEDRDRLFFGNAARVYRLA